MKITIKNPFKKKEEPEKKKRGAYQKKECPYCHKHYGNLENHIKMVHKTEAEADGHKFESAEISKESLLKGVKPVVETKPEDIIYYCTSCKAQLRKGENPCWNCGEPLVWEGII